MRERIKSWALTILVALSVLLTWQLWTFQPNYETLHQSDYLPSQSLGQQLSLKDVVWPDQLVFHNGNRHTGLDGSESLFSIFYEEFLDARFENITLNQNYDEEEVYRGQRAAELIFPTPIPGEILDDMLNIESDTPYLSIDSVDRIILVDEGGDTDGLLVKFISYEEPVVLEGETNFSLSEFRERYVENMFQYPTVFPYELSGSTVIPKTIYLPEQPVSYHTLSDTSTKINYNHFIRVLFSNPDSVKQYRQDNQEATFTDGNRMMSLEDDGDYLSYVNPVYSETVPESQNHVVAAAFDFINAHEGWTDNYRLSDWQRETREESATYRMVVSGLPVFESKGRDLASINVSRAGGQVSEFSRPLFNLDESPIDTRGEVELASGRTVVEHAEKQFEPSEIEDIKVGYQMEKTDNLVVRFEPSWYIKYGGSWYPIGPIEEEEE